MTFRDNAMAVLRYQKYDKLPVVSFGYWGETVQKWADEGHITREEADDYCRHGDNGWGDRSIMKKLGFDFNWNSCIASASDLFPSFEEQTLEERPDGSRVIRDGSGLIVLVKPGIVSIPAEIGTSLTDRDVWENEYLPRLRFSMERIPTEILATLRDDTNREIPVGLHCGSLMGRVRDLLGVEQMSYLTVDDPDLLEEIIDTMDSLCYDCVKAMLDSGAKFDYAHFWEDICFKKAAFWQLYRKWEASGMAPEASHSLVFRFRFVCADADRQDFAASIRSKSSAHASVSAHGTTALSVFPSRMQRMDSSIS